MVLHNVIVELVHLWRWPPPSSPVVQKWSKRNVVLPQPPGSPLPAALVVYPGGALPLSRREKGDDVGPVSVGLVDSPVPELAAQIGESLALQTPRLKKKPLAMLAVTGPTATSEAGAAEDRGEAIVAVLDSSVKQPLSMRVCRDHGSEGFRAHRAGEGRSTLAQLQSLGHKPHVTGTFLWCIRCGAYGERKLCRLMGECGGKPKTPSARDRRSRLIGGKHPTRNVWLAEPCLARAEDIEGLLSGAPQPKTRRTG